MAGERIFLEAFHRFRAHPFKKVVGLVVLTHVVETKTPILALARPPFGSAMRAGLLTAGPLANVRGAARLPISCGLDADAVEEG